MIIDASSLSIDEVFALAKEFVDGKLQIDYDPWSN